MIMDEHLATFEVREIETNALGVFMVLPSSVQIAAGMTVRNSSLEGEQGHFLVTAVVRGPTIALPRAREHDFRVGDVVVVDPGKTAHSDLLLQASASTWFLPGRGVVVGGTAEGIIAKGDQLVLCTEGGRHFSCRCEFIQRFDDGSSGRPTRQGEGVGILLSVDCEEAREALRTGNAEILLREVSAYPSLHRPNEQLQQTP